MSGTSSIFSERMVGLWLRMDAAQHRTEAVAHEAAKAVAHAVDTFRSAVQGGLLYSDEKLHPLTDAINQAMLAAITDALDQAECLMQVARDARALAKWVDDGNTAEKSVAEELAARAELLVSRVRDFMLDHARCATGLRVDAAMMRRLATLWKGELPTPLAQALQGGTRRDLAA